MRIEAGVTQEMGISFQQALGVHPQAVKLRLERTELLTANLANVDTPNFKARDLDFPALLASQSKQMTDAQFSLQTTNLKHIAGNGSAAEIDERALLYRIPNQPSLDQNTVDQQVELAKYTENEIHFETAFTRLNGAFKGLLKGKRTGITGCVTAASYAATTRRSHWRAASAAASAHP